MWILRNRSRLKADMDLDVIRNYKTGVFHHLNPQYLSVPNFLNNSFIYSGSLPVIFLFIWPVKCLLLHYLLALFSISACILYRMTYILTFFSLTGLYLTILIHSYFRYRTHLIIVVIWSLSIYTVHTNKRFLFSSILFLLVLLKSIYFMKNSSAFMVLS